MLHYDIYNIYIMYNYYKQIVAKVNTWEFEV